MLWNELVKRSIDVVHRASGPAGIRATAEGPDNYSHVFARDAVVAGVAGYLSGDAEIVQALERSIDALATHQHPAGFIASNLRVDEGGRVLHVSYGTLSGKVDSLAWFVLGASLLADGNEALQSKWEESVSRAIALQESLEFNGRGLIYTPPGGNWADEYTLSGYLLCDQNLRLLALRHAADTWQNAEWKAKGKLIAERIAGNFWPAAASDFQDYYLPSHLQKRETEEAQRTHFSAGLNPWGADERFDLFGNALAMINRPDDATRARHLVKYGETLSTQLNGLLPAFWPVIEEGHSDWPRLSAFYLNMFKNKPNAFQNGGIWPVWLGWWGLGLAASGQKDALKSLQSAMLKAMDVPSFDFHEFQNSCDFSWGGVPQLCFTAAGVLLTDAALRNTVPLQNLIKAGGKHG